MSVPVPDAKADGEAQRELPEVGIEEDRIMSELKGEMMNYRDVACPNCGTVYGVGYSDVPHSVDKIHRICDTCMMPIEVKNPWNEKETKNG